MNHHTQQLPNRIFPGWAYVVATVLLLVVAVPLFVCSPVNSDTSLFDVQAMTAMRGGVLYRDIVEPNLPGIVWVHIALRSVIGWSSEAIRLADLLILGLTLFVLSRLLKLVTDSAACSSAAFVFVSLLFYLTRNEWCHCQRDTWMMLPTACALWLRFERSNTPKQFPGAAIVEGVFWGIAFWIKPHVAIPALIVLLIDLRRHGTWTAGFRDIGYVILGGVLAAIPGVVWLIVTGAWPHFWDMMLNWNPEYLETVRGRRSLERVGFMMQRFHPWWILHLLAVPLAVRTIVQLTKTASDNNVVRLQSILSAVYLAWLAQTCLLQAAMDYIHVPGIVLAILVIAAYPWKLDLHLRKIAVGCLLGLALIAAPQLHRGRLTVWTKCLSEGSSPEVRSILAAGNYPDWIHLAKVQAFLEDQGVVDGDVTCLNIYSIHLNQQLQVLPSTRYWSVNCLLTMFPDRYDHIMTTVSKARQRFIVVEETESQHKDQIVPIDFPGNRPVVFESGTYKVYAVNNSPQLVQAH